MDYSAYGHIFHSFSTTFRTTGKTLELTRDFRHPTDFSAALVGKPMPPERWWLRNVDSRAARWQRKQPLDTTEITRLTHSS